MRKISLNQNWLFGREEEEKRIMVQLPHDAMIHRRREKSASTGSGQAFFPGGSYIYERTLEFDVEEAQKHHILEFEGVYRNAKVYVNGIYAGGCAYGYTDFYVDCKDYLKEGTNVIRVTCDNEMQPESRWYSGAGIYRPVWLWEGNLEYIKPSGIKITTESYEQGLVSVAIDSVENGKVEYAIDISLKEQLVYSTVSSQNKVMVEIPDAKLWDEDHPVLYLCKVQMKKDGTVVDEAETLFGIRTIKWSKDGLLINGKNTLLRGGCVHHDSGILGAATYRECEFRRVQRLKAAGYNAIRSSHNPASPTLLAACDELGMYVVDEAWDMWFHHKNKYDYATEWKENYKYDLKQMVEKDFNHPCVIMYSIGNEVSEPAKQEGLDAICDMKEWLHKMDSSRAVTAGFNLMIIKSSRQGKGIYKEEGGMNVDTEKKSSNMSSTMFNLMASMVGTGMNKAANSKRADAVVSPALDLLDIAGYNYASGRYPLEGKAHPERIIYGSETFPQDVVKNWKMVKKFPYLVGDFMWTSWDYLGEVGVGSWAYTEDGKGFNKPYPWLLADCGAFDILGNPGMPAALASAAWEMDHAPVIGVQPLNHPGVKPTKAVWRGSNAISSWSWHGCDGAKATVEIYSSAASVELFQDGRSIGRKKLKDCKATYRTKYHPGELAAVVYDVSGKKTGESRLCTAKENIGVHLIPEQKQVISGQICFVDVVIADAQCVVESAMDENIKMSVTGGELLAFGSANPRTEERFDAGEYRTYYGRALAIIRAGESGVINIVGTTKSETVTTTITIQKGGQE